MNPPPAARRAHGFTLVELLIVVVILAILAGIVIPTLNNSATETAQTAFAHELRIYVDAAVLYEMKEGQPLGDGSSGQVFAGWEPYVNVRDWELPTPVGGSWDSEDSFSGVEAAVGVHFNGETPKDDAYMSAIDAIVDDGNLGTGAFQKFANDRFYFVVSWED